MGGVRDIYSAKTIMRPYFTFNTSASARTSTRSG